MEAEPEDEYEEDYGHFAPRKAKVSFPPGRYQATIKLESKRKIVLQLEGKDFPAHIPRGNSIPEYDGAFSITSSDLGQPYDLRGHVSTSYERGPEREDWESCTYRDYDWVCYRDRWGGQTCRYEPVDRWGSQRIRYYNLTTIKDYRFRLLDPGTEDNPAATMDTEHVTYERVYLYRSRCW